MSAPVIPARPQRSQAPPADKQDIPQIPPRPTRKFDLSPDRESSTRSPLNVLPGEEGFARPPPRPSNLAPSEGGLRRPPSIALPSEVGQEGLEYTSYDQLPPDAQIAVEDAEDAEPTRSLPADIPIHAPTASVPMSTAKSRIATVTRTDSTQAAAAGIGRSRPDDDVHRTPADPNALSRVTSREQNESPRRAPSAEPHPLRARNSFNASNPNLNSGSHPGSIHGDAHFEGIPEIGRQVPLLAHAGDVQAPSPGQLLPQHAPGIGFFNDGSARAHHRKKSSRHDFGPADIYGLHGHGREPQDQFEREWLAKHPKQAAAEGYNVFTPRPETAYSTEQLNKLVHNDHLKQDASRANMGTPTQDIAFDATDLYTARMSSPKPNKSAPTMLSDIKKRPSSGTQPAIESPLRKASFPRDVRGESALDSEDEHVFHIDPNDRRPSKITGGGAVDDAVDLGPNAGNTEEHGGWFDERGEGTPILASDEIIKRPGSAFQQPAVAPEHHREDDFYDSDGASGRRGSGPPSRPSSRPGSSGNAYHGGPLHRFVSQEEQHGSGKGTPLEEIEEYEPLFPEDDNREKPKAAAKIRPRLEGHHFPSQDVWEDTPSSLQYMATVETPEPEKQAASAASAAAGARQASMFETPEQERTRRMADKGEQKMFNRDVLEAKRERPGFQRFPSQDIWEDTPDSHLFVTTVSGPQMDEIKSPPEERPTTSAIPFSQDDGSARSTTSGGLARIPSIPARPERRSKLAQEITPDGQIVPPQRQGSPDKAKPSIPDRPKPSIPARPARGGSGDDGAPLSKSISAGSDNVDGAPAVPKTKPAVPARPAGNKFASLKAGFMNDLNSRLQLGPQQHKSAKDEQAEAEAAEAEKAPLADARKGRAKGPPRRTKPAAAAPDASGLSFAPSTTLWHIDEHERLNVPSVEAAQVLQSAVSSEPAKAAEPAPVDFAEPAPATEDNEPVPAAHAQLEKVLSENEERNTASPALTSAKAGDESVPAAAPLDDVVAPSSAAAGADAEQPLSGQMGSVEATPVQKGEGEYVSLQDVAHARDVAEAKVQL